MKLWVDDLRPPPDETWRWAKTVDTVLQLLEQGSEIHYISLDHDMGGDETTRKIVLWFCERNLWPAVIKIHTANVVGREWLEGMVNRYGPGVTR